MPRRDGDLTYRVRSGTALENAPCVDADCVLLFGMGLERVLAREMQLGRRLRIRGVNDRIHQRQSALARDATAEQALQDRPTAHEIRLAKTCGLFAIPPPLYATEICVCDPGSSFHAIVSRYNCG